MNTPVFYSNHCPYLFRFPSRKIFRVGVILALDVKLLELLLLTQPLKFICLLFFSSLHYSLSLPIHEMRMDL